MSADDKVDNDDCLLQLATIYLVCRCAETKKEPLLVEVRSILGKADKWETTLSSVIEKTSLTQKMFS